MVKDTDNDYEPFLLKENGKYFYAYKNNKTGKFCKQKFDDACKIYEGWGKVKIGKKWTYFNPSIGKICKRKFSAVEHFSDGFGEVKIGRKWTFFNPSTGKLCKQRFGETTCCYHGYGAVRINKTWTWTYFIPSSEFCFSARFQNRNILLSDCLRMYPEEFDHLPTVCFRDKDLIHEFLDAMADGIKDSYSNKGSKNGVEQYAKSILSMAASKIEKEKKNIEIEDKMEKSDFKKEEFVNNIATNIRNLENRL